MKAPCRITLLCCLALLPLASIAQQANRNSLGIQLNPFIDEHFFTGTFFKPVYALRYTFSLGDNLNFGPEASGYWLKSKNDTYSSSDFRISAYARYSFLQGSRIRPFIEGSAGYTFYRQEFGPTFVPYGSEPRDHGSYFSWYAAPGVSLWTKSRRMSLDLMYKFSDRYFVNGNKSVFSYRVNFWF